MFVAIDRDNGQAFGPFESYGEAVTYMSQVLIATGDWEPQALLAGRIDPVQKVKASNEELEQSMQDLNITIHEMSKPDIDSFKA